MSYNPRYYKSLSPEKKKKRNAQMQRYNRAFQTFTKELLYFVLGRQCQRCGNTTDLTFDVKKVVNEPHHRINTSMRYRFYFRQMLEGNLQVLCFSCNASKGDEGYYKQKRKELENDNEPF